jgi:hypothetical protein
MTTSYEQHPLIQITGETKVYQGRNRRDKERARRLGLYHMDRLGTPSLNIMPSHGYTEQDDYVAAYIASKCNIPVYSRERKNEYINGMYNAAEYGVQELESRKDELTHLFSNMNRIPLTFFEYDTVVYGKDKLMKKKLPKDSSRWNGDNLFIEPMKIKNEFMKLFDDTHNRERRASFYRITKEKRGKNSIYEYKFDVHKSTSTQIDDIVPKISLKDSFIKEYFNEYTSEHLIQRCGRYKFVVDGLNMLHGRYNPSRDYRENIKDISKAYRKAYNIPKEKYIECLLVLRGPISDKGEVYIGGKTRDKILKPFASCRKRKAMNDKYAVKDLSFNVANAKVYVDVLYVWQSVEVSSTWAQQWRKDNNDFTANNAPVGTRRVVAEEKRWRREEEEQSGNTGIANRAVCPGGGVRFVPKKKFTYLDVVKNKD